MKKILLMALAVGLTLTACEKSINDDVAENSVVVTDEQGNVLPTKKFTFTLKGDFSTEWKQTRGYLQADGRDLTDIWVLDYMGSTLVQQIHQTDNTAEDFGKPVMNLAIGSHHVYFIASRGTTPTLDTENKVISWVRPSDTFFKDYSVDVVATSNGNRAVTLDRVVTKLKLFVTDALPTGSATANITPTKWYYGWNYVTGAPAMQKDNQEFSLDIPSSYIGIANYFSASMFGFSAADAWQTDIQFAVKKSDSSVLGSVTIEDVSFKANRSTEYSGPLFGTEGSMTLSLNSTWDDAETGTW